MIDIVAKDKVHFFFFFMAERCALHVARLYPLNLFVNWMIYRQHTNGAEN